MNEKKNEQHGRREREKGKGREEKWGREAGEIEQISVYHFSVDGSVHECWGRWVVMVVNTIAYSTEYKKKKH